MKRILTACLICLVLAGCSIRNAKITADNKEQLLEDATWSWGVSGEEVNLLASAFRDSSVTGTKIEGKTVGEVLDEQRKLSMQDEMAGLSKAEARGRNLDEVRAKDRLDTYISVTPTKKVFLGSAIYDGVFDSRIQVDLIIDNLSGKEIKSVSGKITFRNESGKIVMMRLITYYGLNYGDIKAGEKRQWATMHRNNELDPDAKAFKDTPLERLAFEWQTRHIVFSDDTSLGVQ